MSVLTVMVNWVHLLCAVLFLGTMFVGTFVLMPVLKEHLEHAERRKFIVHFIPKVRSIIRVVVTLIVATGIVQILLHGRPEGPFGIQTGVVVFHVFFAAVPVLIFAAAPKILGANSKDGLCCDPDADDPPIFKGIMSSKSSALHYIAISGGWLAVLCAVILGNMS